MAEETAGIGNAAALITRARPQDFGILQGLKMAESSALAKAKLEAAREAKKQAKLDRMMRYTTKVDRLKEPYTQKKANELAMQAFLAKEAAAESGDIQASKEADIKYDTSVPYVLQEDEKLHSMNPYVNKDGVETVTDVYKAYNQGGLESAISAEPSWLPVEQRIIQPSVEGDFSVRIPKKIDLDNTYSGVIKRFLGDDLVLNTSGKITTSTRKLTAKEIKDATRQLYDDPNYIPYILHNKDFRKYYETNYSKGDPEKLKDPVSLDRAIDTYTRERLVDYNDTKITSRERGRGGFFMFNNGLGASTSKYDFFRQDLPIEGFRGLIENEKINFGDADVLGQKTQKTKYFLDLSDKLGSFVTKVELPQDAPFSLTIEDKERKNPSLRNVKPLDLVKTQSGQIYLIYGDGNDQNYTRHITPATTKMLNSLKSFYYKDDAADIAEAVGSLGIDLNKGFERNSPTVTGKKPKPTATTSKGNKANTGAKSR